MVLGAEVPCTSGASVAESGDGWFGVGLVLKPKPGIGSESAHATVEYRGFILFMKAVLFDAEGTLIDCAEQTIVAWQRTLRLFGYDISKAELRQQAGRATDEMLKPGARRVKDPAERVGEGRG
jgi:hypothetical protein